MFFEKSVLSLIVFAVCIIMFVTEKIPIVVSSTLGCVLMVALNIAPFEVAFGEFASSSVFLCGSMMIAGKALYYAGITEILSIKILKITGNNERRLLIVSVIIAGIISAFMSNVGTLAMFMFVFSSFKVDNSMIDLRQFMLPIAMATIIGGGCTLVGSGPQIAAQQLLIDRFGFGLQFFEYAKVGTILLVVLVLYVYFIGYPIGKRIWKNKIDIQNKEIKKIHTDKKHMVICAIIFFVMIVCLVIEPLPIAVIVIFADIAFILTGCINIKQAIDSISLRSLIQLGSCLGLMEAITYAGGTDILYNYLLQNIANDISPYMLFFIVVVIAFVLSEFMTNTVAVILVLPFIYSFCTTLSLNPTAFTIGIVLASTCPMSTPLSCTPLTMVMEYGYHFNDYVKYSLVFDLISLIIIVIFVPMIYGLTI